MISQMPSIKDLDERIDLNLEKDGLSLEEIRQDTNRSIKALMDQCNLFMLQIKIYKALIERVSQRINERDADKAITKE